MLLIPLTSTCYASLMRMPLRGYAVVFSHTPPAELRKYSGLPIMRVAILRGVRRGFSNEFVKVIFLTIPKGVTFFFIYRYKQ